MCRSKHGGLEFKLACVFSLSERAKFAINDRVQFHKLGPSEIMNALRTTLNGNCVRDVVFN